MSSESPPGLHFFLLAYVYAGNGLLTRDWCFRFLQAGSEGLYRGRYLPERPFTSFGRTATTFDAGGWSLYTL
ncbi:protocatechuate 3,4-dioxygenase subunit alpha, partial [Pseudomonas aeruginosa]